MCDILIVIEIMKWGASKFYDDLPIVNNLLKQLNIDLIEFPNIS